MVQHYELFIMKEDEDIETIAAGKMTELPHPLFVPKEQGNNK